MKVAPAVPAKRLISVAEAPRCIRLRVPATPLSKMVVLLAWASVMTTALKGWATAVKADENMRSPPSGVSTLGLTLALRVNR